MAAGSVHDDVAQNEQPCLLSARQLVGVGKDLFFSSPNMYGTGTGGTKEHYQRVKKRKTLVLAFSHIWRPQNHRGWTKRKKQKNSTSEMAETGPSNPV